MHVTFTSIESEPRPPPRCSHAATALEGGIIVLGGGVYREHRFKHYADAWLLEAATATWRELPLSDDFVARRGHSAVHDVARDRLIVAPPARTTGRGSAAAAARVV